MCTLWQKANIDLDIARMALAKVRIDSMYKGSCCYNIQQCIEKCLKYVIDLHGISYKFKHDLTPLIGTVTNLGIEVPKVIKSNIDTINAWESSSRYDVHFDALDSDITEILQAAEQLLVTTKDLNIDTVTEVKLQEKLSVLFPDRIDDLSNLINEINACIPPKALNSYGHNKIERVYNFAETYSMIFGRGR